MLALDLIPRRDDSGAVVFGSIVSQSDPPADAGTLKEGRGQRAESRRSIKSRFKLLLIELRLKRDRTPKKLLLEPK